MAASKLLLLFHSLDDNLPTWSSLCHQTLLEWRNRLKRQTSNLTSPPNTVWCVTICWPTLSDKLIPGNWCKKIWWFSPSVDNCGNRVTTLNIYTFSLLASVSYVMRHIKMLNSDLPEQTSNRWSGPVDPRLNTEPDTCKYTHLRLGQALSGLTHCFGSKRSTREKDLVSKILVLFLVNF